MEIKTGGRKGNNVRKKTKKSPQETLAKYA